MEKKNKNMPQKSSTKQSEEYDNPWTFNDKPFTTEQIGNFVGFCYVIECKIDGRKYIGRKYFYSRRKTKGKSRRVKSESNWKSYYGSNEFLKEMVKFYGVQHFRRIILSLHITEGDCNYEEVRLQFEHNVLETDLFLNENINGKWHNKPQHIIEGRLLNECYKIQDT